MLIPNLDKRHPLVTSTQSLAERLLELLSMVEEAPEGDEGDRLLGRLFK
jgi:hypothetical protein